MDRGADGRGGWIGEGHLSAVAHRSGRLEEVGGSEHLGVCDAVRMVRGESGSWRFTTAVCGRSEGEGGSGLLEGGGGSESRRWRWTVLCDGSNVTVSAGGKNVEPCRTLRYTGSASAGSHPHGPSCALRRMFKVYCSPPTKSQRA